MLFIWFPLAAMRRSGFSIIEMVLVLGVVSVMTGISVPIYRDYQIKSDLNLATEQVSQGIERARLLSQSATQDSGWGFFVPQGVLYRGESYIARDPSFDETYSMPSTIKVNGLLEVAFSPISGDPTETGQIQLTTINDAERTILIEVQQQSVFVVTADPITICVGMETRAVPESEAGELLGNGTAVLGACSGSSGSSVASSVASEEEVSSAAISEEAVSSAIASEAASSSVAVSEPAASSAGVFVGGGESSSSSVRSCGAGQQLVCHVPPNHPSHHHNLCINTLAWPSHRAHGDQEGACTVEIDEPIPTPVCGDRITLEEDGSITTLGDLTMTVKVLGSAITFGIGGPEIDVMLRYSKDGGHHWVELFRGRDVDGGEMARIGNIPVGSNIVLEMEGYYREHGWLRFHEVYTSNDQTGQMSLLRNGALLPNYPVFDDQASIASFLGGYLAADGTVQIGDYDVLLLGELGSLNTAFADFQDVVLLLQFSEPTSCN